MSDPITDGIDMGKPKPIAPAIMVDARQETLHKESGKVVRTKVIRKGAGRVVADQVLAGEGTTPPDAAGGPHVTAG